MTTKPYVMKVQELRNFEIYNLCVLQGMIRERWPSLFEKVPPADFILCKIDTSIDKQINEYNLEKS